MTSDKTELDHVLDVLEQAADEQARAGQIRWSGVTLMARQAIRVLAKPSDAMPPAAEARPIEIPFTDVAPVDKPPE